MMDVENDHPYALKSGSDEIDSDLLDCTHCGGTGECDDDANPLWDCDDQIHACHACGGSGERCDQRIF